MQAVDRESRFGRFRALGCIKHIYAKEGLFGFYRGCLSNVFRGFGADSTYLLFC